MRKNKLNLEQKPKLLEGKLNCNEAKDEYVCKENLNVIYNDIANGIKIRSRCNWYELGKKSKFFIKKSYSCCSGNNCPSKNKQPHFFAL